MRFRYLFIFFMLWVISYISPLWACVLEISTEYSFSEHVHFNHLGSPVAFTDSSGVVVWPGQVGGVPYEVHEYEPYGADFDDLGNPLLSDQDVRYTGKLFDASTGKHYFNARYYNAVTETALPELPPRFLSPDIIIGAPDSGQSWNRYAYCVGNPIRFVDPDGLLWKEKFKEWAHKLFNWLSGINEDDELSYNDKMREELGLYTTRDIQEGLSEGFSEIYSDVADQTTDIIAISGASKVAGGVTGGLIREGKSLFKLVRESDEIFWIGGNVKGFKIKKRWLKVTTDLKGGVGKAKDLFKILTGKEVIGKKQVYEDDLLKVVFREESSSGTPALEIWRYNVLTMEKIHFNLD